jgi:hypothetical protein
LVLQLALIVDQQFGVTDDVDKQDVRDLELKICNFSGHKAYRRIGGGPPMISSWLPDRREQNQQWLLP